MPLLPIRRYYQDRFLRATRRPRLNNVASQLGAEPEALTRYLAPRLPGDDDIEVAMHSDGHANAMFFVKRGASEWVLRRPPVTSLLPVVMDVKREYLLLRALKAGGARVPEIVLFCDDEGVLGSPFYLMERIEGVVLRGALPPYLDNAEGRRRIGEEMIDGLVEVHDVDWRGAGLESFAKSRGYVPRMIERWWERFRSVSVRVEKLADIETLAAWLSEHQPEEPAHTIVHADYHLLNLMYEEASPARLVAIFDWETAGIGDPLVDLGWTLCFWPASEDGTIPMATLNAPVVEGLNESFRRPGWVDRDELIERYTRRRNLAVDGVMFYVVLALWRMAIISEGAYSRSVAQGDRDAGLERFEESIPALAARALRLARTL